MTQNQFIFSGVQKYRLQRHISFWIFWWLFFGILYSYTAKISILPNLQRIPIALVDSAFFLVPHMFLSYSVIYFVIPQFILKEKYFKGAASILLLFLITAIISAIIGSYLLPLLRYQLFSISYADAVNNTFLLSLLAGLRGAITIGGVAAAIKLMKHWYIHQQKNLQLEKESIKTQLELLKAQIHPHFLFNTLNNIYAHTQNTSPVASGLLISLSDLLRYIIYDGNAAMVPLQKELTMINDYIRLEKMRYGESLDLYTDLPSNAQDLSIAPLLLLPLVENSFKHGTSTMLDQPWINLRIEIKHNRMIMKLVNGKINNKTADHNSSGIGIKNVKQRLSILYPGKHELTISNEEDVFIVNLKIDLESNHITAKKPENQSNYSYA